MLNTGSARILARKLRHYAKIDLSFETFRDEVGFGNDNPCFLCKEARKSKGE